MSETKNEERTFLHDISTPLTVAMGMAEATQDILSNSGCDPKALEMLGKSIVAMEKMSQQIHSRRTRVKQLEAEEKS